MAVELKHVVVLTHQVISNKMLLSITDITKKQNNKAVLIKAILYMCCYVALSNVF